MSHPAGLAWWVVLIEQPSTDPHAAVRQAWTLVCADSAERAIELGAPRHAWIAHRDHSTAHLRVTAAQLHSEPATQQKRERVMAGLPRSNRGWFAPRPLLYPWRYVDADGALHDYDEEPPPCPS